MTVKVCVVNILTAIMDTLESLIDGMDNRVQNV